MYVAFIDGKKYSSTELEAFKQEKTFYVISNERVGKMGSTPRVGSAVYDKYRERRAFARYSFSLPGLESNQLIISRFSMSQMDIVLLLQDIQVLGLGP